jgi:serine/threonine protein phosphatase 1
LEALRELREAIAADSAYADTIGSRAQRRVVVYLGDYIDRGPDSRGVLDLLIGEPLTGFESIHLLGNHETFMRDFLDGEDVAAVWMMNGGVETLRSYGLDPLAPRAALNSAVPKEHRAFLDSLALSHIEGDYYFVHAGIRPGVPLEHQEENEMLWIREPFLGSTADHGKVVVHGHSVAREPDVRPNRIGIDTGACYGGKLTALVLEDARRRFLQV